jgi:hypothetical protein
MLDTAASENRTSGCCVGNDIEEIPVGKKISEKRAI